MPGAARCVLHENEVRLRSETGYGERRRAAGRPSALVQSKPPRLRTCARRSSNCARSPAPGRRQQPSPSASRKLWSSSTLPFGSRRTWRAGTASSSRRAAWARRDPQDVDPGRRASRDRRIRRPRCGCGPPPRRPRGQLDPRRRWPPALPARWQENRAGDLGLPADRKISHRRLAGPGEDRDAELRRRTNGDLRGVFRQGQPERPVGRQVGEESSVLAQFAASAAALQSAGRRRRASALLAGSRVARCSSRKARPERPPPWASMAAPGSAGHRRAGRGRSSGISRLVEALAVGVSRRRRSKAERTIEPAESRPGSGPRPGASPGRGPASPLAGCGAAAIRRSAPGSPARRAERRW